MPALLRVIIGKRGILEDFSADGALDTLVVI